MIKYKDKLYVNTNELKQAIGKKEYTEAREAGLIDFFYKEEKPKEYADTKLYYFYNPINKHTITSCEPTLDHLQNVKGYNINEWIPQNECK